MDLETLFITVYVLVDDWYKIYVAPNKPKRRGAQARMSDSEVLAIALVGQWRVGVPWQSERGLVRYVQCHLLHLFPTMLQISAFNRRVRDLWGVCLRLQQVIAVALDSPQAIYECVDTLALPAFSPGQAQRQASHWLWESTLGRGAHGEWFWGDHLLASVNPSGAVTGWLLATGSTQDRWLLEGLLSARAGQPGLRQPPRRAKDGTSNYTPPPVGFMGPFQAVGQARSRPYLADRAFNGLRWRLHWAQHYQAQVIAVPPSNARQEPPWSPDWKRWLASHRQIVETAFAALDQVFGIKRLNAHSRWGQYARLASKMAAYNLGLWINRLLQRPWGALATLLC